MNKNLELQVFARDGRRCCGCHKSFPTKHEITIDSNADVNYLLVDHVDGRSEDISNLQTLCYLCNCMKAGKSQNSFRLSIALKSLGRCVTYYPSLAMLLGLKEAIFLCHMIYWTPRGRHQKGDGWIYKSSEEIKDETGLSYKEQIRLRRSLVKRGLLIENHDRKEHVIYFRVDADRLDEDYGQLTFGHMLGRHMPKGQVAPDEKSDGTCPKVISYKEAEITTESTTYKSKTKAQAPMFEFELPSWIPEDDWKDYEQMRRSIRKPLTDASRRLAVKRLDVLRTSGSPPDKVLQQSTFNSWQGLFEIKGEVKADGKRKTRAEENLESSFAAIEAAANNRRARESAEGNDGEIPARSDFEADIRGMDAGLGKNDRARRDTAVHFGASGGMPSFEVLSPARSDIRLHPGGSTEAGQPPGRNARSAKAGGGW